MNKELVALEDIILYLNANEPKGLYCENIEIIKTALQDNHLYKCMISRICNLMGLDINSFEDLVKIENEMINYIYENECFRVDVATNKDKLKAFEIIKEKRVDIHNLLISKTVEQYNGYTHWLGYKGNLTKEEFDLLKRSLV